MHQFNDEELMAYADGAADAITTARIDKQLETDAALQKRLEAFVQTADWLAPYNTVLEAEIPDNINDTLNTVTSFKKTTKKPKNLPLAMAASIALCVGLGLGYLSGSFTTNDRAKGVLHAALPNALNQQASGMPLNVELANARYEIMPLGTFKNAANNYCRRFELTHLPSYTRTGLACKADDGEWDIHMLLPPGVMQELQENNGNYKTASSGSALVKATLNTMGFDQIVSTEEEESLIQNNWNK